MVALSEEWQRGGMYGSTSLAFPLSALLPVPVGQLGSRHHANVPDGSCRASAESKVSLCAIISRESVVHVCGDIFFLFSNYAMAQGQHATHVNWTGWQANRCVASVAERWQSCGNGKRRPRLLKINRIENKDVRIPPSTN